MTLRSSLSFHAARALLAGAMLLGCSSSSTPEGVDGGGGGQSKNSAASSSHGSGGSSNASNGSSGHPTSSGPASSQASTGATGASSTGPSASATGQSSVVGSSGSAASGTSCPGGPAGGTPCDPGQVVCANNAECAVPANTCCAGKTTDVCQPAATACAGNKIECDEKADCTGGDICCLKVTNISGAFSITCQAGTKCPSGIASAQVCKTDAECGAGGTCSKYSCMGQITEACESPSTFDCTKVN